MAWQKGQSGNPGGRPNRRRELAVKISEMDDVYRERLHHIALSGEHKDSTAAIKLLWGYAHGHPTQPVTGENGSPLISEGAAEITLELARRLAETLGRKP